MIKCLGDNFLENISVCLCSYFIVSILYNFWYIVGIYKYLCGILCGK